MRYLNLDYDQIRVHEISVMSEMRSITELRLKTTNNIRCDTELTEISFITCQAGLELDRTCCTDIFFGQKLKNMFLNEIVYGFVSL